MMYKCALQQEGRVQGQPEKCPLKWGLMRSRPTSLLQSGHNLAALIETWGESNSILGFAPRRGEV